MRFGGRSERLGANHNLIFFFKFLQIFAIGFDLILEKTEFDASTETIECEQTIDHGDAGQAGHQAFGQEWIGAIFLPHVCEIQVANRSRLIGIEHGKQLMQSRHERSTHAVHKRIIFRCIA